MDTSTKQASLLRDKMWGVKNRKTFFGKSFWGVFLLFHSRFKPNAGVSRSASLPPACWPSAPPRAAPALRSQSPCTVPGDGYYTGRSLLPARAKRAVSMFLPPPKHEHGQPRTCSHAAPACAHRTNKRTHSIHRLAACPLLGTGRRRGGARNISHFKDF